MTSFPLPLLRLVKLMKHLEQCALFNPGHIAARNPELLRDLALRFFLQIKAEAPAMTSFSLPSRMSLYFLTFSGLCLSWMVSMTSSFSDPEDIDETGFVAAHRLLFGIQVKSSDKKSFTIACYIPKAIY
jgi:hypothetical protein